MRNKLIFIIVNCCLLQSFICDTNVYNPISDDTLPATQTTGAEDDVVAGTKSEAQEPLAVTAAAVESGNTELLSPSLRGLAAMATANLPVNLRLVEVIEATREVVAGFRYDLTVEVTGADGHVYPCRLAILERPWITTEWGARDRSLLSTNCSIGADLNSENNELLASAPRPAEQQPERPTEIPKVEPNYDSIADSGQVEELLEQFTDKNPEQVQEHIVEQRVTQNVEQRQQQKHFLTRVEAMVGLKKWLDDVRIIEHTEKPYVYDATMDPVIFQSAPVNYHKLAEEQQDDLLQHELQKAVQEIQEEQRIQQERQLPEQQDTTLNVIGLDDDQTSVTNGADETRTRRDLKLKGAAVPVDSSDSYVQELIQGAFAQLVSSEGSSDEIKLHKVTDCTKQVVSGSKVKCTIHVKGLENEANHECEVTVWDRPWLENAKETDIDCSRLNEAGEKTSSKQYKFQANKRVTRQTLGFGAPTTADPNGEYLQELMQDAFTKLVASAGAGSSDAKLHELTDCTSQVVAGISAKCTMHVHGLGADEKHECKVSVWDRSWLPDARETEITCTKIHENGVRGTEKKYEFKPKVRVERSAQDNKRIIRQTLGGESTADPNGEYIQELMQDAFTKLVTSEGASSTGAKLHKLTDCTTQSVAGIKAKCIMHVHGLGANEKHECQVEVWDRSWLPNGRQTEVTCSKIEENGVRGTEKKYTFGKAQDRKKRGLTAKGAPTPVDANDSYVQELMQGAFAQLVSSEGSSDQIKLHKVTDCTKQVVSGSKVKCTLHVKGLENESTHECLVTVWDQPWLENAKETDIDCSKMNEAGEKISSKQYKFQGNKRVVRSAEEDYPTIGGPSPIEANDSYVQELIQSTLSQLATAEGAGDKVKLHKVTDCTSQLVAGNLVKCVIHLEGLTAEEKHECKVKVWDRVWLPNSRETDVTCTKIHENGVRGTEKKYTFGKAQDRKKRGIPGGVSPADPSDSYVQELMQNTFAQLVAAEGAGISAKLHQLTDCTQQTVAGKLLKCKMHIHGLGADEKHECEVKVWDRPGHAKENRETDVTCTKIHENGVRGTEKKYQFHPKVRTLRSIEEPGLTHEDLKTWRLFAKFTQKHDKRYDADEARYRFGVFKDNLKRIERLNRGELGTAHYGITQFSDLTPEEFRSKHTGLLPRPAHAGEFDNEVPHASATIPDDIPLPESFDWRDHGAVAKVKDQGSCGSCWAFSVTGNIEGLNAIRTGNLQEFSEQELVDCDTIDSGCGGGLPDNAYKAIEQLGGLESETDYPYEGKKERCHFDKSATKVQVSGAVDLPANETAMALWLVQNGPISIGINANAMQFYRGGVSHPWKILCKKSNLDHGVLIVGYGVHTYPKFNKTMPYWIIKNSWGPRWGEQGYYRVYRGDGTCGVDQMATSAVLDNPN